MDYRKKRSVMRRYNLTAQIYDSRYREEQAAKYKAALKDVNVGASDVVLDLGCGSGLFFHEVAAEAGSVVGVDISKQLLLLARERAAEFPSTLLVLADADHLPFLVGVFSRVFAFTVLQNMPKPKETLIELKHVSKPDTLFVVTGLKATLSLKAFSKVLEKAGLNVVSIRDDEALRCRIATCISRHE